MVKLSGNSRLFDVPSFPLEKVSAKVLLLVHKGLFKEGVM